MKPVEKTTGFFKSFDDTRIYYETRGSGPPIIFVYGIGCLMNHWIHQIKYFSNHYQVITFDYRAHHQSEIPQDLNHLSLDCLSKDVVALMDHLQLTQAHFVGHSFGVQLLINLYDLDPHRFITATFINGFVKNPLAGMFGNDLASRFFNIFKSGFLLLPDTLSAIWRAGVQSPISLQLSALAGGFNLNLTALKDVEIYARGVACIDLQSFIKMFEFMLDYDGSSVLSKITIPVLVIAGKKDSVTPFIIQEKIHREIKNSGFLLVPYGSHCTQLDAPELVNHRMDQFIKKGAVDKPVD